MKQIIILLIVFAAFYCDAQDSEYLKLWNEYVDECSVIVQDTITEKGVVSYEISQSDGELKLIPKDTVWDIIPCSEYKEIYWGSNISFATSGNHFMYLTSTGSQLISTSELTKSMFEADIERTKICNCKLSEPTRDQFWQWLKDNNYRK